MNKIYVRIRSQFVALHRFQGAPKEVDWLSNLHRHVFKVEVTYEVSQLDRAIEFFIAKKKLDEQIATYLDKLQHHLFMPILEESCESLALKILNTDPRITEVVVSEDGENDGIARRKPVWTSRRSRKISTK